MPDEEEAQAPDETPARPPFTEEQRQEVRDLAKELFGIEPPNLLIDMPMLAELAGVAPGTPGAWQQRTREGTERFPFPPPHDDRYLDKPQWDAVRIVEEYLWPAGKWPRGSVARVSTRVTKRYTLKQLKKVNPELADAIQELGGADDKARSVQGWRSHKTRTQRAQAAPKPRRRSAA